MPDLINRLENATGADRALDREILLAMLPEKWSLPRRHQTGLCHVEKPNEVLFSWPAITGSLDAALALVGEVLPEATAVDLTIYKSDGDASARTSFDIGPNMLDPAYHKSPAIALLIALLKAKD